MTNIYDRICALPSFTLHHAKLGGGGAPSRYVLYDRYSRFLHDMSSDLFKPMYALVIVDWAQLHFDRSLCQVDVPNQQEVAIHERLDGVSHDIHEKVRIPRVFTAAHVPCISDAS